MEQDYYFRKISCNSDCIFRKNSDNLEPLTETQTSEKSKRKVSEDFKQKFKTEMCKFWQLNGDCKFKESVSVFFSI